MCIGRDKGNKFQGAQDMGENKQIFRQDTLADLQIYDDQPRET